MIFYFTGTGNSLYVAKELDEEIISIPQVIKQERLEFAADSIGIVCPIYGHEMPGMV
ncbi:MAG: flavodoxin family protein, partial [Lachnospiraceae bacterium]|nr:flavodoxin family protein [Lachnospiraceae bacterium]